MKDTRSESLMKRTKLDLICDIILTIGALVLFITQLISYLHSGTIEYLTNGICTFVIFLELGILALILMEIRRNGKPFSKPIITKLRIMALLPIICGLIPTISTIDYSAAPLSSASNTAALNVTFGMQNFLTILLGVIIAVISEVFVYGRQLQADNDLIA